MEERILKRTAVFVMALSALSCALLFRFPEIEAVSAQYLAGLKEHRLKARAEKLEMTALELLEYNNEQARQGGEDPSDGRIRLELPLGVAGDDLKLSQDYVRRTVSVRIPYAGEEYVYEHPMLGGSGPVVDLTYESKKGYGVVEFVTDRVYEAAADYDEDFFYIDFLDPKEVYDKVVVIDAGHGGNAPGAEKQGVYEKDIDLAIVLKLKEIFEAAGDPSIGVYYTRTKDENPSFESRAGLANKSGADLLVSVHGNSTPSGRMSSINGTQALYDETRDEASPSSKEFAQICLEEVVAMTGSSNKGLVTGSEMYLVRNSEAPVALIEVGFMTNQTELNNLCSEEYQQKIAQGIYNAVMRAFAQGY